MAKKPAKKAAAKKAPAPKKASKSNPLAELESQFNEITSQLTEVGSNFETFKEGTRAAGGRMRKSLMVIRKTAQLMRKSVMAQIKVLKASK